MLSIISDLNFMEDRNSLALGKQIGAKTQRSGRDDPGGMIEIW